MDFTITAKAKEKIMELLKYNNAIKLTITGFSCCSANLGIVSVKQSSENEKKYSCDGIEIIVSEDLDEIINGAKIDYVEGFFKKDFEIIPIYKNLLK